VHAGFEGTPAEEMSAISPETSKRTNGSPKCRHCGTMGKYHAPDCPHRS